MGQPFAMWIHGSCFCQTHGFADLHTASLDGELTTINNRTVLTVEGGTVVDNDITWTAWRRTGRDNLDEGGPDQTALRAAAFMVSARTP